MLGAAEYRGRARGRRRDSHRALCVVLCRHASDGAAGACVQQAHLWLPKASILNIPVVRPAVLLAGIIAEHLDGKWAGEPGVVRWSLPARL